ncbi:MAG: acyl-[Bacteroidales bacterium]|nr:acyl-[acyl-carrier-protein] thioesterase [Bacteroidales bacterium]
MLLPKKGRYTFKIEQYQCNVRKMLRFSFLVNTMLSAADYHSSERGFGTDYLNAHGKTWVLSRLAVEMMRIPSRHEVIAVETWVEKVHPLFTSRNFRMSVDSTNEVLGWGRSVWAMIDTTTRHPVNLLEIKDGAIQDFVIEPDSPDFLEVPISKPVRIQAEDLSLAREVETFFSDVDFNGHINSMRYLDHILDLFPLEWHKKNNIKRLDIAYVAEGKPEIPIRIYKKVLQENPEDNSTDYGFKILQKLPENQEETEACRLRLRTIPLMP